MADTTDLTFATLDEIADELASRYDGLVLLVEGRYRLVKNDGMCEFIHRGGLNRAVALATRFLWHKQHDDTHPADPE